jgi:hypothetical protein
MKSGTTQKHNAFANTSGVIKALQDNPFLWILL